MDHHAHRSVLQVAADIWAQRPHGEPQLPFLGRKKKHDAKWQQAEGNSKSHNATAHQHHTASASGAFCPACLPVGLEDRLRTEEDEQNTEKIPGHLPALRSSSDGVSVGGS